MSRPWLLDLYCCEGGASEGYRRAGFDVYGVDLFEDHTQKRYPFPSWRGDVFAFLKLHLDRFHEIPHAVHASPPCWRYTAGTRAVSRDAYPDLIGRTRDALNELGLPYVIENVEGAPLRDPIMLCGTMFGLCAVDDDGTKLELRRHRLFESNVRLTATPDYLDPGSGCEHGWYSEQVAGVYGGARRDKVEARHVRHGGYVPRNKAVAQTLLDIDWMTWRGMYQALPPTYTEHIGRQLLERLHG